jgi:hypothetical protein
MWRCRKTCYLIAAFILIALIVLLFLGVRKASDLGPAWLRQALSSRQSGPRPMSGAEAGALPGSAPSGAGISGEKRSPDETPLFVLQGRVLSDLGEGLRGAQITVFKGRTPQEQETPLLAVQAQEGGVYHLDLEFAEGEVIRVRVEMPGFSKAEEAILMRAEGELARDFPLTPLSSTLSGRTVDAQGRGVAGAVLLATDAPRREGDEVGSVAASVPFATPLQAVSAANGRFAFEDLSPGPIGLVVRAQGYVDSARIVDLKAGPNAVEVRMSRAKPIQVRVKSQAGQPIRDAIIRSLGDAVTTLHARSGGDGLALLGVPEDATDEIALDVKAIGYLEKTARLPAGARRLDVELVQAGQFVGKVTSAKGAPLEGCSVGSVALRQTPDGDETPTEAGNAVTGSDGRFSVESVERGQLRIWCKGFPPFSRTVSAEDVGRDLSIVLEDLNSAVFGRVSDSYGRPLTHFHAILAQGALEDADSQPEGFALEGAFEDPQGRFSFPAAGAGPWTLFVWSADRTLFGKLQFELTPGEATEGLEVQVGPTSVPAPAK